MASQRMFGVPATEVPKKPKERPDEDWIDDLVGALFDPIIVYKSPWMDDMPERLLSQIKIDRLVMNARAAKGEKMTATDSEALAYMYPRCMEAPLSHDWTEIYLYLGTKAFGSKKESFPEDIRREKLSDYQMRLLNDLKDWIYRKRIEARKDKNRQEKKEKKEVAKQEYVEEQMPLL